ncbi:MULTISPECIES: VOC family protein [Methanosarcina]|uniref:Glyoxalase family protein n=3 Tax=Methanosarcina barkeri TaxID=2208 RepID=A0A0G3CE26_METBA|nr:MULTISPECIES: VOC family protein [Methanosarcina]AKJ38173.1 glyoxalase family protein [Methanosarcina barkeri CM1]
MFKIKPKLIYEYRPNYLIRQGVILTPRVIHFEIYAGNIARAKKFYQDVFGWKIERSEGSMEYWNITTGKEDETGIDGGLMKRQGMEPKADTPISTYICTIGVQDIDEYLIRIQKHGGKITMEKKPISGVGWYAYCLDTERNIFGIMQQDPRVR